MPALNPAPANDPPLDRPHWLVLRGGRPLRGRLRMPGDKSISHRALLLAALADGPTRITGLSPCRDVAATRAAIEQLGIRVEVGGATQADEHPWTGSSAMSLAEGAPPEDSSRVTVHGRGPGCLAGRPLRLDCQDSGTTMRLLAGLLAGQDRAFRLTGSEGLARRPMRRVIEPLLAMGADIRALGAEDRPPIEGRGRPLRGADLHLERASAQVVSALLLAGLRAEGETRVHHPAPVRDHTERMLAAMAAPIRWDGSVSSISGPLRHLAPAGGGHIDIPGDLSSAAFLLVAAAILPGSRLHLERVGINPGRRGVLDILRAMGAPVAIEAWGQSGGEPLADLHVASAELSAIGVGQPLVPRAIDELPLLAVLGARARGRTVLVEAGELRLKECDRIAAICEGLGRMGVRIQATEDGFVVEGPCELRGAEVDGHEDHRIVMSLAVAALAARGQSRIRGAERCADSFPGFLRALSALGADPRQEPIA